MNDNPKPKTSPDLMRLAAERSSSKPEFLGFLFNIFCQDKNLTPRELASQLQTTEETLNFLYLCRTPASDTEIGSAYKEYIQNISRGLEVDQKKLSSTIRSAMNLQRLKGAKPPQVAATGTRLALAARDRLDDDDTAITTDQDLTTPQPGETPTQPEDDTK
jgi:hypothetical protein